MRQTGRYAVPAFVVVAVIGAALAMVSLVVPRVTPWEVLRDPASALVRFIDVRAETNLHTWFNVAVLIAGALAHVAVAGLARRAGRPGWPWLVIGLILAVLSLDDLASLHEQLEPLGRAVGGGNGAFHFAWLLPGLVLAAALVLSVAAAAWRLPPTARRWLGLGLTTLLAAAVGLEAVGGAVLSSVGDGPAYILLSHLEEFAETAAAGLFLAAALSAAAIHPGEPRTSVSLSYAPNDGKAPTG